MPRQSRGYGWLIAAWIVSITVATDPPRASGEEFVPGFPLADLNPFSTSIINSVADLSLGGAPYKQDGIVRTYTGEAGIKVLFGPTGSDCYQKDSTGSNFVLSGNYRGAEGTSRLCYDGHPGVDLKANGAQVLAVAPGKVILRKTDASDDPDPDCGCFGNFVKIDHLNGFLSIYGHLKKNSIVPALNQPVAEGDVIAISGNSGASFGPHLHFEVRRRTAQGEIPVDPYVFWVEQRPWSGFGQNARHTGRSVFRGAESSTPRWPAPFSDSGRFLSTPAVARDGTVYVIGSANTPDARLYALFPSGAVKWQFAFAQNIQQVIPALGADGTTGPDETIYVTASGKLYAFRRDGSFRWPALSITTLPLSAPTVGYDGLVYFVACVGGGSEHVFAVDPNGSTETERIRWRYGLPDGINGTYCSPVTMGLDGTVYVRALPQGSSPYKSELVAIRPFSASGTIKWRFNAGAGVVLSPPAIDQNGNLYVGTSNGIVFGLASDKSERWRRMIGGDLSGWAPAIDVDGTLYVGSSGGNLYALRTDNGASQAGWETPFVTSGQTAASIGSNGVLYFTGVDGFSYGVRTSKAQIMKIPTGFSGRRPSIGADGVVYFVGVGTLYAIGPVSE